MSHHANVGEHGFCCGGHRPVAGSGALPVSRREFMIGMSTVVATGALALAQEKPPADASPGRPKPALTPSAELVVQPVLTYDLPERREKTSWRSWGGVQTSEKAREEAARIEQELRELVVKSGLSVKLLPVAQVANLEQARKLKEQTCDALLIYAAGGGQDLLETMTVPERPTIYFLRHDPGPVYLWYEILHPRFLRKTTDRYAQPGVTVDDVVVDDYAELTWRLRALLGLRRTLGQRILAIGGAGGWGVEGEKLAPQWARDKWHLDIIDVPYPDLAKRIASTRKDAAAVADARREAAQYLGTPGTTLQTDKQFVENAFVLTRVFKDLLREHDARALTVQWCMGTIMPMAETTACLPLSLLNDEGYLAFCESDFVVIPSGLLMHHITGTPVFLNDPTWPHNGIVTLAHCTAPRKMDGQRHEPATILTHFESDYGAAPKVEFRVGQVTTNVVPDFACFKWLGFKGTVTANPFLDICRSQTDIAIDGNWQRLLEDMRGFHWMTVYGDCRREVGYAIKHLGVEWQDISA
jgi:hypothetical protein